MTVRELIEKLNAFPPDAVVIYDLHSDYSPLLPEQVEMIEVSFRAGRYCDRYTAEQYGEEKPDYRTVCHFPGN